MVKVKQPKTARETGRKGKGKVNMKKIIGDKLYNTDTATLIADQGNEIHNFYRTNEVLYRTSKGAWFIHGKSSAGGTYGGGNGTDCWGGENLVKMSETEVLRWAEESNLGSDEQKMIAELLNIEEA